MNFKGWGKVKLNETLDLIPEYLQELPGSLWGITTFYNPAGYRNKSQNYRRFRKAAQVQGLKLVTVELAFGRQDFELNKDDADILVQLRGDDQNILWQKEALLNVGLNHLPEDCDKIVWLDCDVIFKNENWIKETASLLERYIIVQPYSDCVRLAKNVFDIKSMEMIPEGPFTGQRWHGIACGVVQNGVQVLKKYSTHGHLGYAWAARREIFDQVGFYDRFILGSGDVIMSYAFYANDNDSSSSKLLASDSLKKDREAWAKIAHEKVKSSVYFTSGAILHLWHGEHQNRQYSARHKILVENAFDPSLDIRKNKEGIWEWSSDKPSLHRAVREYFFQRRENVLIPFKQSESDYKKGSFLFKFDQVYLDVLAFWGSFVRRKFPKFYVWLKRFFPDREAGQKIGGGSLASLDTFLKLIFVLAVACFFLLKGQ
jgi:hypothetical protein